MNEEETLTKEIANKEIQIEAKEDIIVLKNLLIVEKDEKIIEFTISLSRQKLILGCVGIVSFLALCTAAYFVYNARKKERKAKMRAEQVLNMDNAWQCCICQDNEKTIVYSPCNHLSVCHTCDQLMQDQEDVNGSLCPICRQAIVSRVRVHIA